MQLSLFWRQLMSHCSLKKKSKVPHWGTSALQPKAYCTLTPKEFLHSSLEALHTERYAAPQLAKEGTM
jgi:hypothetical protein